jgi:hypothetical protein
VHLQVVFLDDQTRPDHVQQLVLADDPITPFDQRQEHVEGASAQPGRDSVDEQLAHLGLHLEAPEAQGVSAHVQIAEAMWNSIVSNMR